MRHVSKQTINTDHDVAISGHELLEHFKNRGIDLDQVTKIELLAKRGSSPLLSPIGDLKSLNQELIIRIQTTEVKVDKNAKAQAELAAT